MALPLYEFLGRTNDDGLIASQTTNTINVFAHTRIGEMLTIPGDEVLYPVGHGDGNVEGVFCRLGGQWPALDQRVGEGYGFLSDSE